VSNTSSNITYTSGDTSSVVPPNIIYTQPTIGTSAATTVTTVSWPTIRAMTQTPLEALLKSVIRDYYAFYIQGNEPNASRAVRKVIGTGSIYVKELRII
jgi:hypothetical protein